MLIKYHGIKLKAIPEISGKILVLGISRETESIGLRERDYYKVYYKMYYNKWAHMIISTNNLSSEI